MNRKLSDQALLQEQKRLANSERWFVATVGPEGLSDDPPKINIMGPMTKGDAVYIRERVIQESGGHISASVEEASPYDWRSELSVRDA